MTLLAYHNDPAIKAKYVARFAAHRALDEVVQGMGFEDGRGCFVGCTLDAYDHSRFPVEIGWPMWLALLADSIFESLPKADAPAFGTDVLAAPRVGADLEPLRVQFLVSLQRRNLMRLEGSTEPYAAQCRQAIKGVIAWLLSGLAAESAASARKAAGAAAGAAADAVRAAAAWSAAVASAAKAAASAAEWSMAEAAEWSAEAAEWATANAARAAEAQEQRRDLLTLLAAA